jgi:hypothetical protein
MYSYEREAAEAMLRFQRDFYNCKGPYRKDLCVKYAWAIPCAEAIDAIADLNEPIVEIGAGTGYWASLLAEQGVDVVAYDDFSWKHEPTFFNVQDGAPKSILQHPERSLFLCWPPYSTPMGDMCVRYWLLGKGKYLVFVGEVGYGCTGDENMQERLDQLTLVKRVCIPQWEGIHDQLCIYTR